MFESSPNCNIDMDGNLCRFTKIRALFKENRTKEGGVFYSEREEELMSKQFLINGILKLNFSLFIYI